MARPKKQQEIEELKPSEVWEVLDFAKSMANTYINVYTPDLVNSRLKQVNMNPLEGTEDSINKALASPQYNGAQLVGFSQFFEYTNMLYKRTLKYMAQVPSFDYTYECINCDDYSSKAYLKDEKVLEDFFDKFDHRAEFEKVMEMCLRQETFYSFFRDDGEKFTFQEMPQTYCKITGRSEWGLLYDFNMYWFLQAGVSIDMYPPIMKKYFKRVFGSNSSGQLKYNPANAIDSRSSTYVYYTQTSPEDGFWAFKFTPEQIGNVPFLSPMFSDLVLAPLIRKLQKNKYMLEASKMIIGNVPLLKDNKSGNVKDMLAISPETTGKFLGLLRQSIDSVIGLGASPMDGWNTIDFKAGENFQIDYNKNLSSSSGISSRLIYSIDKPNQTETLASLAIDEWLSCHMYPQFESFLNFYINSKTKKYKFRIKLEGSKFPTNRKDRFDKAMELASLGIVDHQAFSSALGQNPHTFLRRLEMTKSKNFVDKLTPIVTAYQQSGKAGAPKKNSSDLTDSGTNARDYDSNDD